MPHITEQITWALNQLRRIEEAVDAEHGPEASPTVKRHRVKCVVRILCADKIENALENSRSK